jgi:peptidoglycan-N-acetylglucosamine deacetylase
MSAITQPGILLTFDDHFIESWHTAVPLFRKYGARATFFISEFDKLSSEQIDGLKILKHHGHAIGCHGLGHLDVVEFLSDHSPEEYLSREIRPALDLMTRAGLPPTCFAYPCSSRNPDTDTLLLTHFHRLRSGAFLAQGQTVAQLDSIFTPAEMMSSRRCLLGKSIDTGDHDPDQIFQALDRVKQNRECLVLYSHDINDTSPQNHITPSALETILQHAQKIGLTFHTFDTLD